jgi:FkbM family methyltransferase
MLAGLRTTVRRFFPVDIKHTLTRIVQYPWVGRAIGQLYGNLVPTSGFRIDVSAPAIRPETKAALFWGMYESAEIRCVAKYFAAHLDAVDLGSSLGVIACHIHSKLAPGRRIVCVEADPALCHAARSNLRRNAFGRSVIVLNRAIHYGADTNWIRFVTGDNTTTGRVHIGSHPTAFEVPALTLSDVLAEAGITTPYALFADIEGAEAGIVMEDGPALLGCRQIIAELHETQHRNQTLSPRDIADQIEARHGLRQTARDGNVWVFDRP